MPSDYEKQSYWHTRFASEKSFEWLIPSATFMDIIEPHLQQLPSSAAILHFGLGTSDLQNHLRKRGFTNITNADYEELAIEHGRQRELDAFGDVQMTYLVADATCLDMPERQFDLVVDKCAADAISCGGSDALLSAAQEIAKYLAPDGIWISLSYSASRFELPQLPFEVQVISRIPAPKLKPTDPDIYHYCYLLRPKRHPGSWEIPESSL
ncbi:S-adenosyl-L-methionine-dependent methyltransferase [Podospora didyma]|uniref:S-adenosyl-L-methionine-dependent methyltransferase n=1 Tax=Podospora didyma TaxID=330526 RepID=A0AAE0P3J0_9PEZI|nr:S-adenosyl-L-methionine-dependent methyltransferase [Podospora didyma]